MLNIPQKLELHINFHFHSHFLLKEFLDTDHRNQNTNLFPKPNYPSFSLPSSTSCTDCLVASDTSYKLLDCNDNPYEYGYSWQQMLSESTTESHEWNLHHNIQYKTHHYAEYWMLWSLLECPYCLRHVSHKSPRHADHYYNHKIAIKTHLCRILSSCSYR